MLPTAHTDGQSGSLRIVLQQQDKVNNQAAVGWVQPTPRLPRSMTDCATASLSQLCLNTSLPVPFPVSILHYLVHLLLSPSAALTISVTPHSPALSPPPALLCTFSALTVCCLALLDAADATLPLQTQHSTAHHGTSHHITAQRDAAEQGMT